MKSFLTMANYNTWVNAKIFQLCAELKDEAYRKETGSFFESIHRTLNHILLVDILWLARLRGESVNHIHSLDQILYDDLGELTEARKILDQELVECVQAMDGAELDRPISYTRMTGQTFEDTAMEMLITMFTHQIHHRGQVHTMLTQSGIKKSEMPDLDVVDYLAYART